MTPYADYFARYMADRNAAYETMFYIGCAQVLAWLLLPHINKLLKTDISYYLYGSWMLMFVLTLFALWKGTL